MLGGIFYVHDSFFESAKIVMICSLNLDLSSFEELFPILGPLTTQLTLLNKKARITLVLSLKSAVFKISLN
jgi:hypothetical protein